MNKLFKSFKYALDGLLYLFSSERNAKIHLIATLIVIILGWLFHLSPIEWCIVIICCMCVMGMEALNTSIERLTDLVSPEYHDLAKKAKDLGAAAVIIVDIASCIIATIIFLPKIFF